MKPNAPDKNPRQRPPHGTCKLTGHIGPFVASHIIPEALTRPSVRGNSLFQYGEGQRPTRHCTSWYDPELVTAEGERYLSDLDSWAISELRRHKLVWSGWEKSNNLGKDHILVNKFLGVRSIDTIDTKKLRLFFHSLLWRAAASNRPEFRNILVSPEDLELLRSAILGFNELPMNFYPIQLTQLSTKGVMHNQTPIPDIKYLPNPYVPNGSPIALPTFRFYFDGLIAHMQRAIPLGYSIETLSNLVVGMSNSIVLSTVTFEDSTQALHIADVLRDS